MPILKNFILREWFKSFFGAVIILLMLVSVANLISGLLRENVTAREVFLNYLIDLPTLLMQICPVSSLIASLFSVNKLKNRNELTAIFASGFSRRRYLVTICEGAIIVALFQFSLGAFIQPAFRQWRTKIMAESVKKFGNLKSQGLKASTIGSGHIWFKTDKYFFSFSAYDKESKILSEVSIYHYNDNYKLTKKIEAHHVQHLQNSEWKFYKGKEYTHLADERFPSATSFVEKIDLINESPNDFKQIESDITILDIRALYSYIEKLSQAGINTNSYQVMFFERISSPFVCIIFSLLAATLIFNPNRRNSSFGKNLIFVFVFVLFYWLVNAYAHALGQSSRIHPIVACFSVPLMFTIYLAVIFYKNRRLH